MLIIAIINDETGTEQVGNYRYFVYVNNEEIESGVIQGHIRDRGWQELVMKLVSESLKAEEK
jgi:hypothetical protein